MVTIPTQYAETLDMHNAFIGLNGTYYHRKANIKYHYPVRAEAWHNVVFVVCPGTNHFEEQLLLAPTSSNIKQSIAESTTVTTRLPDGQASSGLLALLSQQTAAGLSTSAGALLRSSMPRINAFGNDPAHNGRQLSSKLESSAYLAGTIAFHNPYGYIPAELFGLLPFQVNTAVCDLILCIIVVFYIKLCIFLAFYRRLACWRICFSQCSSWATTTSTERAR